MAVRTAAFPGVATRFLLVALVVFATSAASAKVLRIEITRRVPILDGRSLGAHGGYELIEGRVHFGFDPASDANARITDLDLAPVGADGLVAASADFSVLQAIDPKQRSGTALFDVANRGRRLALNSLNRVALDFREPRAFDPASEADWGDGFLMDRGLTILWVGWQTDAPSFPGSMNIDVPVARAKDGTPIRGLARADWVVDEAETSLGLAALGHVPHRAADPDAKTNQLTRRRGREAKRESVPRAAWSFDATGTRIETPGGFEPGWIYELVYVAESPPLVGLGFAAFRDFADYARYDDTSPFPVARSIATGTSQSGRFLRHFFQEGFNLDEAGRPVFDGALIVIAGAGKGGFNHRFSHPGRVGNPYENFFYPGDDFPFASRKLTFEGETGGVFENERASKAPLKVFQINTGYEYWGRGASLVHMTPNGVVDIAPLENERLYHIASAPHYALPFPPIPGSEVAPGIYRGSAVDTSPIQRAMLDHLIAWVETDTAPPPSQIPRIADGTLVSFAELTYPIASLQRPRSPHVAYRLDFGPRFDQGIIDLQPPKRGGAYAVRVPAIDPLGSEATGIRPLELLAPIGTYTPWALRTGYAFADDEMVGYLGSFIPLACEATDDEVDRRPSLGELYANRAAYEARVDAGIASMTEAGWMLETDADVARRAALARWDWISGVECASNKSTPDRPGGDP